MGVVWAARHTVTRKAVALKMLKPEKAGDAVVRQRFVREARAASAVQHPNIIEIHDVIELEDGAPAMIMDLLEGESLGALLERAPKLSIERLAPIMLQVVSAVGTAHAAGVVHRDLKPDNIFLVHQGGSVSVRVLDFGIAKVLPGGGLAAVSGELTNTGALLGTPYYMSPEQIFGERSVGPAADVWAIGVMLYECLSGRRPTDAENLGQILRIITNEEIPSLRTAAPDVPPDVAAAVDRMLRRDRHLRPHSLAGIFEVLSRHAPGTAAPSFVDPSSSAPAPSRLESGDSPRAVVPSDSDALPTAATLASTTAASTSERPDGVAAARSIRRLPSLLIAGLALVSAAAAFVVSTSRPPRGAPAVGSVPVSAQPATTPVSPTRLPPPPPSTSATIDPPPAESAAPGAAASVSATARPRPPRARTAAPPIAPPGRSPAPSGDPLPQPSPYDHL